MWRTDAEDGKEEEEEVEDEPARGSGSRLARKKASLGMASLRYYTPRRMQGEGKHGRHSKAAFRGWDRLQDETKIIAC